MIVNIQINIAFHSTIHNHKKPDTGTKLQNTGEYKRLPEKLAFNMCLLLDLVILFVCLSLSQLFFEQ